MYNQLFITLQRSVEMVYYWIIFWYTFTLSFTILTKWPWPNDRSQPIQEKITEKWKISSEVFVNRNERFVPLQCQIEEADGRSLRVKIED